MSVERFDLTDFEKVLEKAFSPYGIPLSEMDRKIVGGEFRYHVAVKDVSIHTQVCLAINSSIGLDGVSDPTGENSIRIWITDQTGQPLGNKVGKWITRVSGWEDRMAEKLDTVIQMAQSINYCSKCHTVERVFVVKKNTPNKGRIFIKCDCPNSFAWLDMDDDPRPASTVEAGNQIQEAAWKQDDKSPLCPLCDVSSMTQRHGSKGDFWGCNTYPTCKGSMDVGSDRNDAVQWYVTRGMREAPAELFKVETAPKTFVPSKYQQGLFDWVEAQIGKNLVVEALAGSGKTTTGLEMLKLLSPDLAILFLAFNAHIAKELQTRAPRHVQVRTYHSLGYKACRDAFGKEVKLEEDKVKIIFKEVTSELHAHIYPMVNQLVSLVKANLLGTTEDELLQLADHHGIEMDGDQLIIFETVRTIVAQSALRTNIVNFDDMCWLPVYHNLPMKKYDVIFIDEAQDTNKNQIALALMAVKEDGRIVAVGDRHQSLYGFRGADIAAIPNLIDNLEADVMPLSITYRNPKSVVELVNDIFPHIPLEAADWAKDGIVKDMQYDMALNDYAEGDMVLCRTNAPLVQPAFALIRKGVKAIIRGRDIGKGLLMLINKMGVADINELLSELIKYKDKEVSRLLLAKKNAQAQSVEDKVDTILALMDGTDTILELEDKITTIFSDDNEGVVFSSVHKAKGLEAERVFILRRDLMPHPMAEKQWEMVQESNIEYVAYTRTLDQLVFVGGG